MEACTRTPAASLCRPHGRLTDDLEEAVAALDLL
jgi:hypothetical protein